MTKPASSDIKTPATPDRLLCIGAGMLTGKYGTDSLPPGPRGLLFGRILPGIEPLTDLMRDIAAARQKTVSQVQPTNRPDAISDSRVCR